MLSTRCPNFLKKKEHEELDSRWGAGNHAQGVALAASKTWPQSRVIVMPITAPDLKVNTVRRLGGEAVLLWRLIL